MLFNNICLVAFLAASATAANLDNKVMISPANTTKTADRKLQSPLPFLVAANDNNLDQLIVSDGAGSFTVSDLPGGNPAQHYTKSVAICDVNGDGFADILSVDWITGPRMLINNGNNEFTASELPDNGDNVNGNSIICSDVDGDGDLDVVVGYVYKPNQLLFNDGSGSFTLGGDLPGNDGSEYWTNQVIAADMNGDGKEDIIMGNNEINHLLINNGNGQFTKVDLPGLATGGTMTVSIAAADIDNDGDLDLIIGNENGATANYMLLNDGSGSFTVQTLPGGNLRTFGIYASDMNGDGNVDIIVGNINDSGGEENQVLFGDGSGSFTVQALPGGDTFTTSVITADVDDDGDLDIIVANGYYDESQLLINDGTGSFALSTLPGGVDRATNYIAASFGVLAPSSPQASQLTANTWAVTYQGDAAVDFTSSSTDEVTLSYTIGAGKTPTLNLYASADCSTETAIDVAGLATTSFSTTSGDSLDTIDVSIDFDKTKIVGSNIWDALDSSLEFCLAVKLESGGMVVTEDLQTFDIAFNFDVAFSADTFAATEDSANINAEATSANVNDYISACKCDGTTCNASALGPDDLLQVCIMSSSSEVVVSQVTELDLAQTTGGSMAVVDGGNIGNAALSEMTSNSVKTVVPAKFFTSTDAISVSGVVQVAFAGRRQLVAFGDNDAKSTAGRMMLGSPLDSNNPEGLAAKDSAHHIHLTVDPPSQEVEGSFDFEVGVEMATEESKFNAAATLGITKVLVGAVLSFAYLL